MQVLRAGASSLHNLEQVQAMIVAITTQLADFVRACLGPQGKTKLVKKKDASFAILSDGLSMLQVCCDNDKQFLALASIASCCWSCW